METDLHASRRRTGQRKCAAGKAPPQHEERGDLDSRRVYRVYFAGFAVVTPPVGTSASAVLVDFTAGATGSVSEALLTKRSCTAFGCNVATGTELLTLSLRGSTSATASVVTRLVSRNSAGDSSCRSSHGGTLSASDSRSPAPPMSKVYLAR